MLVRPSNGTTEGPAQERVSATRSRQPTRNCLRVEIRHLREAGKLSSLPSVRLSRARSKVDGDAGQSEEIARK
jgi:hypothetical protein